MITTAKATLAVLGSSIGWLGSKSALHGAVLAALAVLGVTLMRPSAPIAGASITASDPLSDVDPASDLERDRPALIDGVPTPVGSLARQPVRRSRSVVAAPSEAEPRDPTLVDNGETDNDLPAEAPPAGGAAASPFEGPSSNGLISLGGGARGAFAGRSARKESVDEAGGALRWLAAHQSPDGGWGCEGWRNWCDGAENLNAVGLAGAGRPSHDVGVTGLALLAFLGAGYTNRSEGAFGKVVGNGLKYLRNVQDAEGCFGDRSTPRFVYNHAVAALAIVEAYGMTGSSIYKSPAQKALDFVAIARNPYFAWRYGVKPGDNDTAITGFMMMAMKSATLINAADVKAGKDPSLAVDEDALEGVKAWIEKMTDPDTGRVGYQQRGTGPYRSRETASSFPAWRSEATTAIGMLARIFAGEAPANSDAIQKGSRLCADQPPAWRSWDGSIDFTYWYFGTLSMYQVGGTPWKAWEAAMKPAIVDTQRRDGDFCFYKGSWDPIDAWGEEGGRVYATATMVLCCEVWYRYDKVAGSR